MKLARLRQKITAVMLAERAGISRATLSKVEKGNPGISMGVYASVLFCLRLEEDLLLLAGADPLGRHLQDAGLLQTKQRVPKRRK
ncbi:helix-turn-helix domain-containing protein [Bartonella sp. DGB2]|uniref:helix-turn-helix domain-containing protein n=1 Tax=Bartonella sp. DGB2 TaxID=3388426 RepID=UPI00398FA12D